MDRKVVTKICLPALSQTHVYRTFKITPRQVHAHAYVNAGFLFNMGDGYKVKEKPSICFGGIREGFVHAVKTEDYLTGKCLNDPNVMQIALKTLAEELNPEFAILEADPEYRRNLAQGLLYKTILGVISQTLEPKMKSGAENLNRFKQVSQGTIHKPRGHFMTILRSFSIHFGPCLGPFFLSGPFSIHFWSTLGPFLVSALCPHGL